MAETSKPSYAYIWASGGDKVSLTQTMIQQGWTVAKPSYRRANAVENRQDQMLQHIDQHGIAVWSADTEYFANKSWVTGSNGELYRAVADSVGVNPVGDTSNKWYRVLDEFFTKTQADARYLGLAVPSGAVFHFAMQTAPAGYLVCNGAAVSRTAFAALFAAIGTLYGTGDGSTTFNLPDLRGEFIRGADLGRGVDGGRVLGSGQGDAIRNITGRVLGGVMEEGGSADGAFYVTGHYRGGDGEGTDHGISFDASRQVPTSHENRPRNVALLPCIKT